MTYYIHTYIHSCMYVCLMVNGVIFWLSLLTAQLSPRSCQVKIHTPVAHRPQMRAQVNPHTHEGYNLTFITLTRVSTPPSEHTGNDPYHTTHVQHNKTICDGQFTVAMNDKPKEIFFLYLKKELVMEPLWKWKYIHKKRTTNKKKVRTASWHWI